MDRLSWWRRGLLRCACWLADAEVVCSRCGHPVAHSRRPQGFGMTAGYYVVAAWRDFCNPGEVYVCDACMWADPRYRAIYGVVQITQPE